MRAWTWAIVAAAGFGLMATTHQRRMATDPAAPWAAALMVIGEAEPPDAPEGVSALKARVVLLPLAEQSGSLVKAIAGGDPKNASRLATVIRPKLIELPPEEVAGLAPWLRSGRTPEPGGDEVLAGAGAEGADLHVAGRTLKVVGSLRPDVALFAGSYLVPASPKLDEVFQAGGKEVETAAAALIRFGDGRAGALTVGERIAEVYPTDRFQLLTPRIRPDADAFHLYLAGQALFLLGGSGLLIGLYRRLAARAALPILADPLREIAGRPGLIWGVHLVYFGLYVAGSLAAYAAPDLNTLLMSNVTAAVGGGGRGPLAAAGRAYRSGNIPYAALVTFAVNFPLGSLTMITLPSLIVPGSGALLSMFRATLWGLLLGPTEAIMAGRMIPHSGTLLLEGEGYILATFFALLVPIYLFGRGPIRVKPADPDAETLAEPEPPTPREGFGRRFVRAVVVNFQGNVLVAIVLIVAACYEAAEVIHLAGF
ncbi:hypothetical protein [Paludisphaera mucosa]|uniref:Uncharacterized protein n=1 Tax=Paludisphaera mucosa TaxID=3030827 RepID=A0ABT6FIW8_9BACT|nr:hypothetical protein [Paludisphaera mucosa]MDG3007523.1 hypothetical protein [Paludisphaera mucosa]